MLVLWSGCAGFYVFGDRAVIGVEVLSYVRVQAPNGASDKLAIHDCLFQCLLNRIMFGCIRDSGNKVIQSIISKGLIC